MNREFCTHEIRSFLIHFNSHFYLSRYFQFISSLILPHVTNYLFDPPSYLGMNIAERRWVLHLFTLLLQRQWFVVGMIKLSLMSSQTQELQGAP